MKNLVKSFAQACASAVFCGALSAGEAGSAAQAINTLGLELLARGEGGNAVLSPYSIQTALAMTYAGASGVTRAEMARVLHYPDDEAWLHQEMAGLTAKLEELVRKTEVAAKDAKKWGGEGEPIVLAVANRLFGQRQYEFRTAFLALAKETYRAPLQPMNFSEAVKATKEINDWVEAQTRKRIANLIPPGEITADTRMVLVNAIYLKAPWQTSFQENATKKEAFWVKGTETVDVPTMNHIASFGYEKKNGHTALTLAYSGAGLQLLILLPDDAKGLSAVEKSLTAKELEGCAKLPGTRIDLHLPKFKIEPSTTRLGDTLQAMGMKTAFDRPEGSADFDRMAPRTKDEYLFISQVFHKAFISIDEKGTEAAAATAVIMARPTGMPLPAQPIQVRVDRPFLFAIQHRESGACLFLGRVVDPR